MKIKPEWVLWGIGAGVLALLLLGQRDRNGDGKPDGIFNGLGYDAGRVIPDFVTGAADGFLDGVAEPFGAGYSDCERYKAEGNTAGIYWACWPKDWPIFNGK